MFVLATGHGLTWAAEAGLAVVVGGPSLFQREGTTEHAGLARYRRDFRALALVRRAVCHGLGERRSGGHPGGGTGPGVAGGLGARAIPHEGRVPPLEPAAQVNARMRGGSLTERDRQRVEENLAGGIQGTPDKVRASVQELVDFTRADELLVTGGMSDAAGQQRSDELVADLFR